MLVRFMSLSFSKTNLVYETLRDLKILSRSIQERLSQSQIQSFKKEIQMIPRDVLQALFDKYNIKDLYNLTLKIDPKVLSQDIYKDDIQEIENMIKTEENIDSSIKNTIPLAEPIGYMPKYSNVIKLKQGQEGKLNKISNKIFDEGIMNEFLTNKNEKQNSNKSSLNSFELEFFKQKRQLPEKEELPQIDQYDDFVKEPLLIYENNQESKFTNKVCFYGLPYFISDGVKVMFQNEVAQRFGGVKSIRYFEYRNFRIPQNNQIQNEKQSKYLKKIENRKDNKLHKSYAIVEYETYAEKLDLLKNDLRIFGLKFNDYLIKIDDADPKRILLIQGINPNWVINHFCNKLHTITGNFYTYPHDQRTFNTSKAIVYFSNFENSLKAYDELFKQSYSVYHYPNVLRYNLSEIYEECLHEDPRIKMNQIRIKEKVKANELWREFLISTKQYDFLEENLFHPFVIDQENEAETEINEFKFEQNKFKTYELGFQNSDSEDN
ncbi:hypothetical protein pb186bvf_016339 [Paramecium bursaria]